MSNFYKATRKLKITNAPGFVPSSIRVVPDEIVELDGTEPINVQRLINSGALVPFTPPAAEDVAEEPKPRRTRSRGTTTRESS